MNNGILLLPVLKVNQPIGDFYIGSISAKDLVTISYKDVRRLAEDQRDIEKYLGIQRPISQSRINSIKAYIGGLNSLGAKDATFPTSVILAIDEKCAEIEQLDDIRAILTLKAYIPDKKSDEEPIPLGKIAKILDGQHRIAAFLDDNNEWMFDEKVNNFDINVSIFIGLDISEQASIFATVNLSQTKVEKSLVYDLTELAKKRSPQKTCHNVAVALDGESTSPFFKRIKRLAAATPGRRKEPLTQAAFVEALIRFISLDPQDDRNRLLASKRLELADNELLKNVPFRNFFIQQKEDDIAEILYNYFDAVRHRWPESWEKFDEVDNLLPKSNAFKALMKFLREDVMPKVNKKDFGRIPSADEFYKFFKDIKIEDSDFNRQNFAHGSGGQSTFLKLLRGEISIDSILE